MSCLDPWSSFLDMRRNIFLAYLLVEFVVILCVMALFKFIPDRQIAATCAGTLFVLLPAGMMTVEYRRAGFESLYWFVAVMQFWTVFALPILGLRIFNWGVSFEDLSFLGIRGPLLHQWSSKSYMIMMAITAIYWFKLWKTKKAG